MGWTLTGGRCGQVCRQQGSKERPVVRDLEVEQLMHDYLRSHLSRLRHGFEFRWGCQVNCQARARPSRGRTMKSARLMLP